MAKHANGLTRYVKPWYFLGLGVLSIMVAILAMRSNYTHMTQLRDAVYAADKSGQGVTLALQDLQHYVTHHMNTNLATPNGVYPPIQLKYTYDRLVQAHSEQIVKHDAQNAQVYADAQTYCDSITYTSTTRTDCLQQYVNAHGVKSTVQLQTIPDSLYKFDFASPRWSPDLAGWSWVAAVIALVLFVVLLSVDIWQRHLKR
ncbi:MAG TPA: hypothetical protein VHD60_03275 [Candidatus Saccharimonadales bacterium]|nr:hypothetical protein [Candidatus Saccharimonadales bacterium]